MCILLHLSGIGLGHSFRYVFNLTGLDISFVSAIFPQFEEGLPKIALF
jgi:hypothetical protein